MKITRSKLSNLIFIILIVLMIIPQTRIPIQVKLHELKAKIFPVSAFAKADQTQLLPFDYKVVSMDGIERNTEIGKGKVTFVSYWATWCPPCIAELPSLEKLYETYGNRVQFLFITNENPETVNAFLEKREWFIPAVNPRMDTPEILYEKTIPTNYIIDKEGLIVLKEKGAQDWFTPETKALLESLID